MIVMPFRRSVLSLALGAVLAMPAVAQAEEVALFRVTPSLHELRDILAPEDARRTRSIEILAKGAATAPHRPQGLDQAAMTNAAASDSPSAAPDDAPRSDDAPAARANDDQPAAEAPSTPREPPRAAKKRPAVRHHKVETAAVDAAPADQDPPATDDAHETPQAVAFPVNFEFNSARIPAEAVPSVAAIGELLHQEPDIRLVIEGHTDAKGDAAYNMVLSKKRAEAVKAYLVLIEGIAPARLKVVGKGQTDPLVADPFDAENRRVQFRRAS